MAEFYHPAAAAIVDAGLVCGHLLPKRQHHRTLFAADHRTPLFLILRTTLRLACATLAIPPLRLVAVVREAFRFRVSAVVGQLLAFRTNVNVAFGVVDEGAGRKSVRGTRSAGHIFPRHAAQK